jgi:hypothetical protein
LIEGSNKIISFFKVLYNESKVAGFVDINKNLYLRVIFEVLLIEIVKKIDKKE